AGGTGAFTLALRNPEVFSSVASHSGILAFLYEGPYPFEAGQSRFITELLPEQQSPEVLTIYGEDLSNWRAHDPYSLLALNPVADLSIYFDCGSEDDFQFDALSAAVNELLVLQGIKHEYHSIPGGHDDDLFGVRIEFSLRFHSQHLARPHLQSGD
ncbi:MAG TPA: alpha/beta hydrolase-fold protein, partial [Xanthomonadales bacterium]|nr:alpha/beta hydrolase-fold protein [Xanthomonadales bacterium]